MPSRRRCSARWRGCSSAPTLWFVRYLRERRHEWSRARRASSKRRAGSAPQLPKLLPPEGAEAMAERAQTLMEAGVDDDLALRVARQRCRRAPRSTCAEVAAAASAAWTPVAAVYFAPGSGTRTSAGCASRALSLPADTHWDLLARTTTLEDLGRLKRALTTSVLEPVARGGRRTDADRGLAQEPSGGAGPLRADAGRPARARAPRGPRRCRCCPLR